MGITLAMVVLTSCNKNEAFDRNQTMIDSLSKIEFEGDKFADIEVLKYEIPSWSKLTLKEKLNDFIKVNKSLFWKRTKRSIKED